MNFYQLQQLICEQIEKSAVEYQSLVVIDEEQTKQSYADVLRAAHTSVLGEVLINLEGLKKADSEDSLKNAFKHAMHGLRQASKDTALDWFSDQNNPAAKLCFDLFDLIYPNAVMKTLLQVFAPEVTTVLQIEFKSKANIELKALDVNGEDEIDHYPTTGLIVSGQYAFGVEQAIRGNVAIFQQIHTELSEKYPEIHAQLRVFDPNLIEVYQQVEYLAQQKPTLREALINLYQALVSGGTQITGAERAALVASDAVIHFNAYLETLPEPLKKDFLALSGSFGTHNLEDIIKKLCETHTQCVEVASGWIDNILSNSNNAQMLNIRPGMTAEEEKKIKDELNKKGKENVANNVNPQRAQSFYRNLPFELLTQIFANVAINNVEVLIDFLHSFSDEAIYQAIYERFGQAELTVGQLTPIFVHLDRKQTEIFFRVFHDKLNIITQHADNMFRFTEIIRDDQFAILFESIKDHLASKITSSKNLNIILRKLSLNQCKELCERLKDQSQFQFEPDKALDSLVTDKQTIVIESFQEKIFSEGKTVKVISNFVRSLNAETLNLNYQLLQDMFKSDETFLSYQFIEEIKQIKQEKPEALTLFFNCCKSALANSINCLDHYASIYLNLDGKELDEFDRLMEPKRAQLHGFSNYQLMNMLGKDEEKTQRFYELFKNQFAEWLSVGFSHRILKKLTITQCQELCDNITKLPYNFNLYSNIDTVLNSLGHNKQQVINKAFENQLRIAGEINKRIEKLEEEVPDFKDCFSWNKFAEHFNDLNEADFQAACEGLGEDLRSEIVSVTDFIDALESAHLYQNKHQDIFIRMLSGFEGDGHLILFESLDSKCKYSTNKENIYRKYLQALLFKPEFFNNPKVLEFLTEYLANHPHSAIGDILTQFINTAKVFVEAEIGFETQQTDAQIIASLFDNAKSESKEFTLLNQLSKPKAPLVLEIAADLRNQHKNASCQEIKDYLESKITMENVKTHQNGFARSAQAAFTYLETKIEENHRLDLRGHLRVRYGFDDNFLVRSPGSTNEFSR